MDNEKKIIWESTGYSFFFGTKLPYYHYVLYEDSISVTTGIFNQRTQRIPLYRIAAKEISTNFIGRLRSCGRISLITRGREVPNLFLDVKNPEYVVQLIENTAAKEMADYKKREFKGKARNARD